MLSDWLIKSILLVAIIFIAVVFIFLYCKYLGKDFNKVLYKSSKKHWWIFVIIGIAIFYYNKGDFAFDSFFNKRANSLSILLVLTYKILIWQFSEWRYKSTRFTCDGVSGSCAKKFICGDYAVLLIGSIDYFIPWKFNLKVVVIPRKKLYLMERDGVKNKHMYSYVQPDKIQDLNKLPNEALEKINSFWWINKEEVYYGELSQEEKEYEKDKFETENGESKFKGRFKPLAKLASQMQFRNRNLNLAKGVAEGDPNAIKELSSGATQMKKLNEKIQE